MESAINQPITFNQAAKPEAVSITSNPHGKAHYQFIETSVGDALIIMQNTRLIALGFTQFIGNHSCLGEFEDRWPKLQLIKSASIDNQLKKAINQSRLKLTLYGTPFQCAVWEALCKLPVGSISSYQTIAEHINRPKAWRATGTAIGKNPIAGFIPCHRIIRKNRQLGSYHWGQAVKQNLLENEGVNHSATLIN